MVGVALRAPLDLCHVTRTRHFLSHAPPLLSQTLQKFGGTKPTEDGVYKERKERLKEIQQVLTNFQKHFQTYLDGVRCEFSPVLCGGCRDTAGRHPPDPHRASVHAVVDATAVAYSGAALAEDMEVLYSGCPEVCVACENGGSARRRPRAGRAAEVGGKGGAMTDHADLHPPQMYVDSVKNFSAGMRRVDDDIRRMMDEV